MSESIVVSEPYSGFPGVAHGGYLGGLLAQRVGRVTEVTFRRPPPMDRSLELEVSGSGVVLKSEAGVVADAAPGRLDLAVAAPVTLAEAEAASKLYPGLSGHPFKSCFVCGPGRGTEGVRLFVGPVAGREVMAAPWTPQRQHAAASGEVRSEIVWAALDCPAIWGLALAVERGNPDQVVSGRITVELFGPVRAGQPHVVMSWPLEQEGKKRFCAAAVLTPDGEVLAAARQTCIVTDKGVPIGRWGMKGQGA